uniref:DUF4283 domain-containing protein n=1 Tax=Manihot esculenta TaxID=3983 RepID=A0A199UAI0_MANES
MESFANLNLDDDDTQLQPDDNDFVASIENSTFTLIGKLLTDRQINFNDLKATISNLWRLGEGVFFKELELKLYWIQFFNHIDLQYIIDGGPWSFSNHLLVTHLLQLGEIPMEVSLSSALFWIQIHNLPSGYMTSLTVQLLGHFMSRYVNYDTTVVGGSWRSSMLVRVAIDARLPLKSSKRVVIHGNQSFIMHFKYEKPPIFCFLCGLGHNEKFYNRLFDGVNLTSRNHDLNKIRV